jgi:hypothetical protein
VKQSIQELESLEKQAVDLLMQSAGIKYGCITLEIQVKAGRRTRTEVSVKKTTLDD